MPLQRNRESLQGTFLHQHAPRKRVIQPRQSLRHPGTPATPGAARFAPLERVPGREARALPQCQAELPLKQTSSKRGPERALAGFAPSACKCVFGPC